MKQTSAPGPGTTGRLDLRAAALLSAVVVLAAIGVGVLRHRQDARVRDLALATARRMAGLGQVDLALRNLNALLVTIPEASATGPEAATRSAALELKAELLSGTARSLDQILAAAIANDQYVRSAPDAPGAQAARRRMVALYIHYSDSFKEGLFSRTLPEASAYHMRYRAAAAAARDLVRRGADDADAHRLMARALEGLIGTGDDRLWPEAVREYEVALKLDPGDSAAAERLAALLTDRGHDPARATRTLDELAKSRPESPELRLVRHRFFARLGLAEQSRAELMAALRVAPELPSTCLAAAEEALVKGRADEARQFVARIPEADRSGLRVRLVLGLIDLNEDRTREALQTWQAGLIASGGTDVMLTWNLAFALLQLGRADEARPLVAQYRRLATDDSAPMMGLLLGLQEQKSGLPLRAANRLEGLRERIDPRWSPMLDQTLGQCYREAGADDQAGIAYRRALRANPRAASVRVAAAEILLKSRPDEAASLVEEGLNLIPDNAPLRIALASARLRQQEANPPNLRTWAAFDAAMAKAEAVAPGHPTLRLNRSLRQSLGGRAEVAAALLEEETRREPRKAQFWLALAEAQLNAGRPAEALRTLERASAPGAVGDQAGLRLARARVLGNLGRAREAHELLIGDIDKLAPEQRPAVWEALGRDLAARGDLAGARAVLVEWAGRVPEDPRPRLALLDMALAAPEPDGPAASAELRKLGPADGLAARLDRARELIRGRAAGPIASRRDEGRLREAAGILEAARDEGPQLAALDSLQGELLEALGKAEDASLAYRRALGRGSSDALPRLVDLLARLRPAELERLSQLIPSPRMDRLAAQAFLEVGQPDRAARVVANGAGTEGPAESPGWRVAMLDGLGRPGPAEALLRSEASRRPQDVEPWLTLLRFLARRDRADAIIPTIDEAVRAIRDDRDDFVAARLRHAAGDRPGAREAFRSSLARWPDDVEILLAASGFDQESGRPAEAEAHLRRVLTLDAGNRPAARRLALLLGSRPLDEAGWERAWQALGPESPGAGSPEDRLARGLLLARGPGTGRARRAAEILEALVADIAPEAPQAPAARGALARLLLGAGQADRAARLLAPTAEKGFDVDEVATFAEALLRSGRLDPAGRQLDRLAALAPGQGREGRTRARLVHARARPGDAAPALERAFLDLQKSPASIEFGREAFAILATTSPPPDEVAERIGRRLAGWDPGASWMPATIAGRHGRGAEALAFCRAAAEAGHPADAREAARVAFAAALAGVGPGPIGELETILEAAARSDAGGTEIPLLTAQLRHHQGRFDEVIRLYREVIDLRPDLRPSIQNNLAWVLSEDLHRPDEAIRQVDELLASQGRTAATLDTRGVILTRLGRPAEAIGDLEESTRIAPNPVHIFHLARAYRSAGRVDDFRRCRDLARRSGLRPESVTPSERAEVTAMLTP